MTDMANTTGRSDNRSGGQGQRRGPGGPGGPGGRGGPGGPGGPGGRDGFGPRRDGRPPRGRERERETSDMTETVIAINRVAKVVKGGRRFSFNAIVAVGDGKGKVGVALGKANEIADAIRKASESARAGQIAVPILNNTIPYAVVGKFGSSHVMLKPAAAGTGVIAAGGVRAILEAAGIKNVLTKQLGSRNPHNVWKATMDGLDQLRSVEEIAAKRGISVSEVFGLVRGPRQPVVETAPAVPAEAPAGAPAEAPAETTTSGEVTTDE